MSFQAWRLLSILAAYFGCSEALKPYLIEHLTLAATDRRGTASVCLTNLRKTARCGGRKNVKVLKFSSFAFTKFKLPILRFQALKKSQQSQPDDLQEGKFTVFLVGLKELSIQGFNFYPFQCFFDYKNKIISDVQLLSPMSFPSSVACYQLRPKLSNKSFHFIASFKAMVSVH